MNQPRFNGLAAIADPNAPWANVTVSAMPPVDIPDRAEQMLDRYAVGMPTERRSTFFESALRIFGRWHICPGCRQSCTGQYLGHQACTRCHIVVVSGVA